ncbi:hypothetical protein LTR66_016472, partial [Elasticomyces elasticus]
MSAQEQPPTERVVNKPKFQDVRKELAEQDGNSAEQEPQRPPRPQWRPNRTKNHDNKSSRQAPPPDLPRRYDILEHCWPLPKLNADADGDVAKVKDSQDNGNHDTFTAHDGDTRQDDIVDTLSPPEQSTLNSSAEDPAQLVYLLLFHEANPRCQPDGIIFAKTNLHLLPAQSPPPAPPPPPAESDDSAAEATTHNASDAEPQATVQVDQDINVQDNNNNTASTITPAADKPLTVDTPTLPIAVFEQQHGRADALTFTGYYNLVMFQRLEPQSQELARMLEQKFTVTNKFGVRKQHERNKLAWRKSMEVEWAVLKFVKVETGGLEEPK